MSDYAAESELVIGLVGPVGAKLDSIVDILKERLTLIGYEAEQLRLSHILKQFELKTQLKEKPDQDRYNSYMDAGNECRRSSGRGGILALAAAYEIFKKRPKDEKGDPSPLRRAAHILRSLKHPEEVRALRHIYGPGFFLVGVHSSPQARKFYLMKDKGIPETDANALIARDEEEEEPLGQQTRDTFQLSDAFVSLHDADYKERLWRILELLFRNPFVTPTRDEHAMFLAYGASLRSGDLSRQVGAVIVSKEGEVIATGANDVPKYKGGLYSSDDGDEDGRDWKRGVDSNREEYTKIACLIIKELRGDAVTTLSSEDRKKLQRTGLLDITEYGRAVHAEMEALLACARSGVSPRNGTLYSTTFPCHNCAKHIVAAGIRRVVYVEPYPKSKALELHQDSISLEREKKKVRFEPFEGIGPRRFIDLFSMKLGGGDPVDRKKDGKAIIWSEKGASLRVPMLPQSYLDKERIATDNLLEWTKGSGDGSKEGH